MKFRVQFKDPDALPESLRRAAEGSLPEGLDEEEPVEVLFLERGEFVPPPEDVCVEPPKPRRRA